MFRDDGPELSLFVKISFLTDRYSGKIIIFAKEFIFVCCEEIF